VEPLSVCITTFNNQRTLDACLSSVTWAEETVVLDSYSTDRTPEIVAHHGCRFFQHEFMGYGKQKQLALDHAGNRWVLLLDADEVLSPELQEEIKALLKRGPDRDGYELPRQEQVFWRMASTDSRLNGFLRLFDNTKTAMSDMPVHAAPKVNGTVGRLKGSFYHFGETDIHIKVEKVNSYSTGLVQDRIAKGKSANPLILIFYPPLFFIRSYVFKRNFINGWAGFITSVVGAFYVFMKYAKVYEHRQFEKYGNSLLPECAPDIEPRTVPK
jgi:glycosyltransferase involved in cell wall biosynthesis